MVNCNWGLPELPDNPSNENLPSVNEVIMGTDTDTDEDDGYEGYEPLPMSAADVESNESESDDEISAESVFHQEESLPSVSRVEDTLLKEVWSAPAPNAVDIEMDNEKVNAVKQAMLNFTLPSSSIPEWANSVPEEEWKEVLTRRLQNMQKK